MPDEYLTALELAAWLKIKPPTVRKWAREGLPCLKAGRLCRYEREQVRAWLEQRAVKRSSALAELEGGGGR
jgi:excisionase family DNA binding protein